MNRFFANLNRAVKRQVWDWYVRYQDWYRVTKLNFKKKYQRGFITQEVTLQIQSSKHGQRSK